jgi:hypothetical protein
MQIRENAGSGQSISWKNFFFVFVKCFLTCYLTTLSVAEIVWRRWWVQELWVRSSGGKLRGESLSTRRKKICHCHYVHIIVLLNQNVTCRTVRGFANKNGKTCVTWRVKSPRDRNAWKWDKILFRKWAPFFISIVRVLFLPQRVFVATDDCVLFVWWWQS